jgi:hypothetical protein
MNLYRMYTHFVEVLNHSLWSQIFMHLSKFFQIRQPAKEKYFVSVKFEAYTNISLSDPAEEQKTFFMT